MQQLVRYSSALRVEGAQAEANRTCQDAIDELRKELEQGKNDGTKSTHLAALSWLAVLYKHIGNRRKAMEVYDQAFDYVNLDGGAFIRNADYETLYSIQGLAEDIDDQRRCQKAEFLHKAVLKTRRDRYQRHPCVDDSLYAYSWNLRLQDRLAEAEKVCQEALDIAREFRGPHRNVSSSYRSSNANLPTRVWCASGIRKCSDHEAAPPDTAYLLHLPRREAYHTPAKNLYGLNVAVSNINSRRCAS